MKLKIKVEREIISSTNGHILCYPVLLTSSTKTSLYFIYSCHLMNYALLLCIICCASHNCSVHNELRMMPFEYVEVRMYSMVEIFFLRSFLSTV